MNQKDKDSLTALLKQMNDWYHSLSRVIPWTDADSICLDDLMHSGAQQRAIADRVQRATGSPELRAYISFFLSYKAWQRTKAVYSFNRQIVDAIAQTGDTSLYIYLLDHLPFKDMLFYFPAGVFPKPKNEEAAGVYIHIEKKSEKLWVLLNFLDRVNGSQIYNGMSYAFPVDDGMRISQIFQTPHAQEYLLLFKQTVLIDRHLDEQEAEILLAAEKKILNTVIHLLYYLGSKDPDIRAIKRNKKPRKTLSSPREEKVPAVELREVGAEYEKIVYRRWREDPVSPEDTGETDEDTDDERPGALTPKRGKKKRSHVRKAHWQLYWTGEGRTTPIVHWIQPLFIGPNRDDQAVVVYDAAKKSMKGKQNPNTSKKKRKK